VTKAINVDRAQTAVSIPALEFFEHDTFNVVSDAGLA